ncbi:DarT ssDNA thymidine ADP-ribosyltransferase family protein [Vibrio gigantis]|uniref:DarT ssDNA thymidine ADP-ribosyltransferase family protein n=1 Tax=Vibrio gigantis TaxID=296199 RepID=UPI0035A71665
MARNDKIKKILDEREIKVLLHFTQLANLPSILENGLKTKDALGESAKCNDELRLDNHTDTISLSIHHPNDPMFFKYRNKLREEDPKADWCVLGIPATILLEQDALFCKRNAASGSISCISEDELRKSSSLAGMFDEIPELSSREEQHLKDFDPTDVQAEVLIKGNIAPEMIKAIVFTSRQVKKNHQDIIGGRQTRIDGERERFLSRRDIQRRFY